MSFFPIPNNTPGRAVTATVSTVIQETASIPWQDPPTSVKAIAFQAELTTIQTKVHQFDKGK